MHHCSTVSAISFFLAHSGQMMSSPSVMKPFPTMLDLQEEQMKQSLCQCRPSNEMNLVPPMPDHTMLESLDWEIEKADDWVINPELNLWDTFLKRRSKKRL